MKRAENPKITLFLVNIHQVYINDNGAENHFPLDRYNGYFDFDKDFDKKLNEFNELKITSDDIDVADGVEKVLFAVEIPRDVYNNHHKEDDFYEYVVNACNYDFIEIKSVYKSWNEIFECEK